MAIPWPVSLNSSLDSSGFSYNIGPTTARSSMDVGPEKVRRRITKGTNTLRGSIKLLYGDFNDLYYFFNTTLNGGVEKFTVLHPITQVLTDFRFVNPPVFTPLGGLYWSVSMDWEELPQ